MNLHLITSDGEWIRFIPLTWWQTFPIRIESQLTDALFRFLLSFFLSLSLSFSFPSLPFFFLSLPLSLLNWKAPKILDTRLKFSSKYSFFHLRVKSTLVRHSLGRIEKCFQRNDIFIKSCPSHERFQLVIKRFFSSQNSIFPTFNGNVACFPLELRPFVSCLSSFSLSLSLVLSLCDSPSRHPPYHVILVMVKRKREREEGWERRKKEERFASLIFHPWSKA